MTTTMILFIITGLMMTVTIGVSVDVWFLGMDELNFKNAILGSIVALAIGFGISYIRCFWQ